MITWKKLHQNPKLTGLNTNWDFAQYETAVFEFGAVKIYSLYSIGYWCYIKNKSK